MRRPGPPPLEGPLQQPLDGRYCSPPPPLPPPLIQESQQHQPKILHSLLHNFNHLNNSSSLVYSSPSYGNMLSPVGPTQRARSGSLGSTGSSIRDSCSPGHESTSSQETMSRDSPMSIGSSPSPSPPMSDSKLLGILRGSVIPQYAHFTYGGRGSPHPRSATSPALSDSGVSLKRDRFEQDEPMDLSCKSKKLKTFTTHKSPSSSSSATTVASSILEAVLCGKSHPMNNHQNWFCDNTRSHQQYPKERAAASLQKNSHHVNTTSGSKVSPSQKVGLAKKTIAPVQARVQDWLIKIVQLAKLQPEFVRLPQSDKLTLILNSWPRILLLHMAENNFQFVVTPVHQNGHTREGTGSSGDSSLSSSVPTMADVEAIQNLICKCQSMNLDHKEYQYIRKSALFHSGYDGLENGDYIDDVNTYIRDDLQVHIRNSRPNEKLRYSNILLCLHTLFGINCQVVDNLFCLPRAKGLETRELLRDLLQEP